MVVEDITVTTIINHLEIEDTLVFQTAFQATIITQKMTTPTKVNENPIPLIEAVTNGTKKIKK